MLWARGSGHELKVRKGEDQECACELGLVPDTAYALCVSNVPVSGVQDGGLCR